MSLRDYYAPANFADFPTVRTPAITRPLDIHATEPGEAYADEDVTDKRPIVRRDPLSFGGVTLRYLLAMSREDGVSVWELIARMARKAYFARYVREEATR